MPMYLLLKRLQSLQYDLTQPGLHQKSGLVNYVSVSLIQNSVWNTKNQVWHSNEQCIQIENDDIETIQENMFLVVIAAMKRKKMQNDMITYEKVYANHVAMTERMQNAIHVKIDSMKMKYLTHHHDHVNVNDVGQSSFYFLYLNSMSLYYDKS